MILNGYFILFITITIGVYYWLGYLAGKNSEQEKLLKDIMELHRKLNEMLKEK